MYVFMNFQTVSLPVVVVKATNQHCKGYASVMWQCFSSDDVVRLVN